MGRGPRRTSGAVIDRHCLLRQKPERQFELGGNQREHVLFASLV